MSRVRVYDGTTGQPAVTVSGQSRSVSLIGVQGPAGGTGGALREFTHVQVVPAATWTIMHDLGFEPVVAVRDTAGEEVEGVVTHQSASQLTLTFSAAFAGTARLT